MQCGYPTPGWMTYQQAKERGAQVRKGEKGSPVLFTRKLTVEDGDEEKLISMIRVYHVWNVAQVDGLPEKTEPAPEPYEPNHIDRFVAATGADIRREGNTAAYWPEGDFVTMPLLSQFVNRESYHATELHETTHWTGAKHRLNRDQSGGFGSRAYAFEELIAELGAAFLCAHLGVTAELRHAGYVQSWIKVLKDDTRALFRAASQAQKAADFIRTAAGERLEEHPAEAA